MHRGSRRQRQALGKFVDCSVLFRELEAQLGAQADPKVLHELIDGILARHGGAVSAPRTQKLRDWVWPWGFYGNDESKQSRELALHCRKGVSGYGAKSTAAHCRSYVDSPRDMMCSDWPERKDVWSGKLSAQRKRGVGF